MKMDGPEIFRRAVRVIVDSARARRSQRAGVERRRPRPARPPPGQPADHRRRLPSPRRARRAGRVGARAHRQHVRGLDPARAGRGRRRRVALADGDLVLLVGFGAGMTGASAAPALGPGDRRRVASPSSRAGTGASGWPAPRPWPTAGLPRRRHLSRSEAARRPGAAPRAPATSPTPTTVEAAFAAVEEELGPVEVLVHAAGINADTLLLMMKEEDFSRVIDANLTGAFRVSQAGGQAHAAGPLGADHLRRLGRGPDRLRRPGQLRRPQGRPGRASPVRWPGSWPPGRSPSTWSAPGPIDTDMLRALDDDQPGPAHRRRAPRPGRPARRGRRRRRASWPPTPPPT